MKLDYHPLTLIKQPTLSLATLPSHLVGFAVMSARGVPSQADVFTHLLCSRYIHEMIIRWAHFSNIASTALQYRNTTPPVTVVPYSMRHSGRPLKRSLKLGSLSCLSAHPAASMARWLQRLSCLDGRLLPRAPFSCLQSMSPQ